MFLKAVGIFFYGAYLLVLGWILWRAYHYIMLSLFPENTVLGLLVPSLISITFIGLLILDKPKT